jgi:hypothetical protein
MRAAAFASDRSEGGRGSRDHHGSLGCVCSDHAMCSLPCTCPTPSSIVPFGRSVFAAHVSAARDSPCLAGGLQACLFASPSRRAPERYKEEKPEAAVGLSCFFLLRARFFRWSALRVLRPCSHCLRLEHCWQLLPPFQNIRCFRFVKQMYLDTF